MEGVSGGGGGRQEKDERVLQGSIVWGHTIKNCVYIGGGGGVVPVYFRPPYSHAYAKPILTSGSQGQPLSSANKNLNDNDEEIHS